MLSSCSISLVKESPSEQLYILSPLPSVQYSDVAETRPRRLLIETPESDPLTGSTKIVFSKDTATRGTYQLARWTEPLVERVASLFVCTVENAGLFQSTGRYPSVVDGDYLLTTEILEFFHDASSNPGNIRISMRIELIEIRVKKLRDSKMFVVDVPVKTYSARGAVEAFNEATSILLRQMLDWLDSAS